MDECGSEAQLSEAARAAWSPFWRRRDLLRIGSIGMAATLLPCSGTVAAYARLDATAKSVILLWMAGGVTQFESFDPKPEAPEEVRGTLKTIATSVPGLHFTEVMPRLACIAHRVTWIRSYSHDSNDHFLSQAYALSGRKVTLDQILTEPNIGAVVSYLHGPRAGFPGYIAVPGTTRPGPPPHNLFVGGWLGQQHAPFAVAGQPKELDFADAFASRTGPPPLQCVEDLSPEALTLPDGLTNQRVARRAQLKSLLDGALGRLDQRGPLGARDGSFEAAYSLLDSSRVRRAFELSAEPATSREAYGRTKIGGRCLLARRLVEAGARFVMVDYGYDPDYGNLWDNHCVPVQRQPHISEMAKRPYHLAGTDQACAALIEDLAGRGLLESTLVVFLTEFGRTPRINAEGGRDHWGPAGTIFFAGGGAAAGRVIGATDRQGAYPTTRGYSPADVAATIYRAIAIRPDTQLTDRQNRPLAVLPHGEAIPGVLG
jgi:hypothetical protein